MHFSGAGEAWKVFKNTFPAPKKYIYTHFSGSGEVLIYTYLAPERLEKPEKYLYTPGLVTIIFIRFEKFYGDMVLGLFVPGRFVPGLFVPRTIRPIIV